ncbi:hypothetical protein B0I73DRAFT_142251 [Yarrowia lipolytica]|uniref:Uncharacterized protein n=1 Tax=Yarrowia lipolytica TaxID=4952 RepID=A0A371C273_YARLL|nr:hypothetical protein B0I71DRAFT_142056 [Yarrowia lipolytica]RDW38098.1 hypothetical protein B0I73DRAFT_142251 [Yarrowia lipolytica]RDW44214.1 hypothetical protein B0I74DRAFT_130377 [Yarrowia lipolytica]RDW50968.1 hypothetical protein B0I75DRAFT_170455 [Yarrowia lipolytica]
MASYRATETSYLNFLSADLIAINDKFAVEFLQDAAGTHHLQYSFYQGDEAVNPKSEFVVRQGFQYEPIEDRTFGVVDILCRVIFQQLTPPLPLGLQSRKLTERASATDSASATESASATKSATATNTGSASTTESRSTTESVYHGERLPRRASTTESLTATDSDTNVASPTETFWCLLRCYFRNADPFTAVGTGDISSSTTLMIVTFSTNGSGGGEGSEDGSEGGSGGGSNNGPGDYGSNGSNGSNGGSGNYLYMRKNRRTACLIREP